MEPISTLLFAALTGGAAGMIGGALEEAGAEAYRALKQKITALWAGEPDLADAIDMVERNPESETRKALLEEELTKAVDATPADEDDAEVRELRHLAQTLLARLGQEQPTITGNRNVSVGTNYGNISTGDGARQIKAGTYVENQMVVENPAAAQNQPAKTPATSATSATAASVPDPQPKIKILFLAANPLDTKPLQLDEEVRGLDQALQLAQYRDRFDLEQQWAVRVSDLQNALLRYKPDIVHFAGHSSQASQIKLMDGQGQTVEVPQAALNDLFALFKTHVRCVVLNACHGEEQARGIAQAIDCVIGMSGAINDQAAANFTAAFYRALAYGESVQRAFDLAQNQLALLGLPAQEQPRLMAERVAADRVRFVG